MPTFVLRILLFAAILIVSSVGQKIHAQQTFTNIAGAGLDESDIPYAKDGGLAFSDYDLDGDLDLVVNTNDNNATRRSYLLRNDNGVYTDVTNAVAPGLKANQRTERSAAWGDCNQDGYPDLMVNSFGRYKILINNGGVSFSLHINSTAITNGINTEGLGWIDYDNDGDLDYFIENDSHGVDLFRNDGGYPNPTFTQVTIDAVGAAGTGAGGLGLPEGGSTDGDYATALDLNNDGYVDIVARRRNNGTNDGLDNNPYDIFLNDGDGTFTPLTTFNEYGNNADKGGVQTADFDNDGDFDILWASGSTDGNRAALYENTGFNSLNFALVPNPFDLQNGSAFVFTDTDGIAIGDIDLDGDLDVFMTRNGGGSNHLFLNNSTGPGNFAFRQPGPAWIPGAAVNFGINIAGDGEGCAFVDYDNDGDVDLYVNRNGAANQLWRNDYIGSAAEASALYQNNYIRIIPEQDLGAGSTRLASNVTVVLKDCEGNTLGGIRDVGSGGAGHGAQNSPWLVFGLPNGPDASYLVEVQFTREGTTPVIVSKSVSPSSIPIQSIGTSSMALEQTLFIKNTDDSDTFFCEDIDMDGTLDFSDLDDDNDGILDTDECASGLIDLATLDFTEQIVTLSNGTTVTIDGALTDVPGSSASGDANGNLRLSDGDAANPNPPDHTIGDRYDLDFDRKVVIALSVQTVNIAGFDGGSAGGDEWRAIAAGGFSVNDPDGQLEIQSQGADYVEFRPTPGTSFGLASATWGIATKEGVTSIAFECSGNPASSLNVAIQCADTDGDGLTDNYDIDSDNDGCFDAIEAGFTDANMDGEVDGSGYASDGTVTGSDGYTGTDPIVTDFNQVAQACDTDGDGVNPAVDLDDDNDGLTDCDESNDQLGGSISWNLNTPPGGLNVDYTSDPDLLVWPISNASALSFGPGASVNLSSSQIEFTSIGSITLAEAMQNGEYIELNFTTGTTSHFLLQNMASGWYTPGNTGDSYYSSTFISAGVMTGFQLVSSNVFHTNTGATYEQFDHLDNESYLLPNTSYSVRFYVYGQVNDTPETSSNFDDINIQIYACEAMDTDGDGIADHLDPDSDGDGCLDALEAGFTDADMDGEVDGTGYAADGTVTGSDGYTGTDPIVTDYGLVAPSCDTDGDGVNPDLDLDDDNDGIPDTEEGCGNLLVNGDFENQNFSDATAFPDGFTDNSGTFIGTSFNSNVLTGWTYDQNMDGWVGGESPSWSSNTFADAFHGSQFVDVLGNNTHSSGANNTLSQDIATVIGETYVLSFFWGEDVGHSAGQQVTLNVKVTGSTDVIDQTITATAQGVIAGVMGPKTWYRFEQSFVANATTTTISFHATPPGSSTSAGAALDVMSVRSVSCQDTDGDGVDDYLDLDSDNDGIFDLIESGQGENDINGDGIIDGTPADFGANGLFDDVEDAPDSGVLDEPTADSDGDGNIDSIELDSDNDGCNDIIEAGYDDPDENGILGDD